MEHELKSGEIFIFGAELVRDVNSRKPPQAANRGYFARGVDNWGADGVQIQSRHDEPEWRMQTRFAKLWRRHLARRIAQERGFPDAVLQYAYRHLPVDWR